jgi:spore germination protein KB
MIWPLVKEPKKIVKMTLIATTVSGVLIASFDLLAALVLGESIFSHSIIPMYTLIGMINVGDFIQNLEGINAISFLFTAFIKACIHLFSAVRGAQQLTYAKNSRIFILPVVFIAMYLGMTMASNTAEHIEAGLKILPYNLWIYIFIFLPILLLIVTWIRKKVKRSAET